MSIFQVREDQGALILYDARHLAQVTNQWFEPDYWQAQGRLQGGAPGRGTSAFIQAPTVDLVLRHYRRGGLPGRVIDDCYLWMGLKQTRAWQEMQLTWQLFDQGLPVPRPLAARVQRQGLAYRADLITERLPNALPFSDYLPSAPLAAQAAALTVAAKVIYRFHQAGLNHADLNPRNLMIAPACMQVWLIDFDRCQLGKLKPAKAQDNLKRLYRGLRKLDNTKAPDWFACLLKAYKDA